MSQSTQENAALHQSARRLTEMAYAFAALAALSFAALLTHTTIGASLSEEARQVVTWSFVGLAAADAALLFTWQHIIRWIAANQ
mgnify:FL=1